MYAEEEAAVLREAAGSSVELATLVRRRIAGEPLEVVVGWADFAGVRVRIDPGVFVPRARTQLLVRLAVEAEPATVLDLCCGSGAVGAAVAASLPGAEVWAADVDRAAVTCARANLRADRVVRGDLFAPLPQNLRGRFDAVVANAPYVPTEQIATMPVEARDHEPRAALDGGADGMALHRRIAAAAAPWLAPDGRLVIETGRLQAPLTVAACAAAGWTASVVTDPDLEATAVVATAPPPAP